MNAKRKRWMRVLLGALLVALGVTGAMGMAHTKVGHPLLVVVGPIERALGRSCPFGYDKKATPAERDAARLAFSADHRGATSAAVRPALGFALDVTTQADVLAWARSHGVSCTQPKTGADLTCSGVPAELLPAADRGVALDTMWMTFGASGKLIAVVGVRKGSDAQSIGATFASLKADIASCAGPASAQSGTGAPEELTRGLLAQASAEYRFANYYALTRATNMGNGILLTEEYRSLAN